MKRVIVVLFVSLGFTGLQAQTPYYFYSKGERQYLELDARYIFVSVADETSAEIFASKHERTQPFRADIHAGTQSSEKTYHPRLYTLLTLDDHLTDEDYLAQLSEIKNSGKGVMVAPYFKDRQINKIGLSNFFYLKLKSLNDTVLLRRLAEREDAVLVDQLDFMPLWWVASVTERSKYNAMETANRFYETGLFEHAYPDLMTPIRTASAHQTGCNTYDPFFANQWGLNGTYGINICDAWTKSTGSGVTVAVFDTGININHPDLDGNIHSYSYDVNTGNTQSMYKDHGTQVSGICGARRNNKDSNGNYVGIAGVAPDCKIMSISGDFTIFNPVTIDEHKIANGFKKAVEIDIKIFIL